MRRLAVAVTGVAVALANLAGPAAAEPGADEPLVFSQHDESGIRLVVQDRRVSATASLHGTVPGPGGGSISGDFTLDAEAPVCPDESGTIEGTVRIELTVATPGRAERRVTIESRLVGHVDDDTQLAGFDLPGLSADVADGGRSVLSVAGDATGFVPGRGDAGTWTGRVVSSGGVQGLDPNDVLAMAVTYARDHGAMALEAAAVAARDGLCIDLQVDAHGVTVLGPGASTPVDATVVDAVTGEALHLPVEPIPVDGTTDPSAAAPSAVTFTYTAPGQQRPDYTLYLQVRSRRGGDDEEVVFGQGWAFSGATVVQDSGPFTGTSTWSGHVCGDPLTTPWTFTQVVDAGGRLHEETTFDLVPVAVGGARPELGTVPMIEPAADAGPGAAPFRLYLDDVAPEGVSPATQRIEVAVQPATTECTGGG